MYSSGSAENLINLMDLLRDFCQSANYTINSYSSDGNGKKLHILKNGRYFNFKALYNEVLLNNPTNQIALFMNASTSFNALNTWYNQTGAFTYNDGASKYFLSGMINLEGSLKYHFFNFNNVNYDVIYVFVENQAGFFQRLLFGSINTQKYGTSIIQPEGMFFSGSKGLYSTNTYSTAITLFGDGIPDIYNAEAPQSAIYLNYSSTRLWHSGNFNISQGWLSPSRPQIVDGICKKSTILNNSLSGISRVPTFFPIDLYVGLTSGNISDNTTTLIPLGELPNIYWAVIRNFNAGDNLNMAKDTYKVFPFSKKSDIWDYTNPSNGTYQYGLMVLNG